MSGDHTAPHPHSAGGIVINAHRQVAIVNQGDDFWSLPKGHLRPGESSLAAARREIYEETGLTGLRLIEKLGSYQRPEIKDGKEDPASLKTITLYLFTTAQQALRPAEAATVDAEWIELDKLSASLSHPADQAYVVSVLHRVKAFLMSSISY